MNKKIPIFMMLVVLLSVLFFSCKGDKGLTGADGKSLATAVFVEGTYPNSSYAGAADTLIISTGPTYNYGASALGAAGAITSTSSIIRGLFKFDLAGQIPAGVRVESAYLTISTVVFYSGVFNTYGISEDWIEGKFNGAASTTVTTWNTSGYAAWTGGNYSTASAGTPVSAAAVTYTTTTMDLKLNTSLVQSWLDSPSTNYGVILKSTDESTTGYMWFGTKEDTGYEPKLTIYYTPN